MCTRSNKVSTDVKLLPCACVLIAHEPTHFINNIRYERFLVANSMCQIVENFSTTGMSGDNAQALLIKPVRKDAAMYGLVRKKHCLQVMRAFGLRKAILFLVSREPVALLTLVA
jgi:hypothetical protein